MVYSFGCHRVIVSLATIVPFLHGREYVLGNDSITSRPLIFHAFVDRLLPANRREATGVDGLRARVLVLSALAISIWGPVFALVYWFLDQPTMAWLNLISAIWVGPTLYFCLRHRSVALGGNALAFILFGLLVFICSQTGGIDATSLKWMPLVPLVAYLIGGWKSCVGWMLAALSALCFFAVAPQIGLVLPMGVEPSQWRVAHITGLFALVIIIPLLFALNSGLQRWLVERVRLEEKEKRRVESKLRRTKEAALARIQKGLRSLIERSPDGIVVFRDGKIEMTNPAFRKMLGYEDDGVLVSSELVGLVASDERSEFIRLLQQIGAGEEVAHQEFCFLRADGEVVYCEVTGTIGVHHGRTASFGLVRDITQRKEVQGRIMHLDRMNAVGTLAAGVAHEINNPLAYVHSNTEYLLSQLAKLSQLDKPRGRGSAGVSTDGLNPGDLVEALEDIREGADRIRAIVADLGSFSETNDKERGPVDLGELMRSVLKMAQNHLRHRAQLVTNFEAVPTIEANGSNLAQVFLNLVVNAAQAIPEGAVDQNEVRVLLRYDAEQCSAIVEVSDTGTGIEEGIKPRVFDPFFSTKCQGEGMGLGLFICRNIVREYDGEIDFESKPGEGTTFRVQFPAIVTQSGTSREIRSPSPHDGFVGRALIIDDEAGVCRTIERLLRGSYDTASVNSGREALELLEHDSDFDVIICDLLMPDVSGVEVYEHLRSHLPRLEARTVFVTGGTFTERTNDFVDTTHRPVVLKPFDILEFWKVVDEVAAV